MQIATHVHVFRVYQMTIKSNSFMENTLEYHSKWIIIDVNMTGNEYKGRMKALILFEKPKSEILVNFMNFMN